MRSAGSVGWFAPMYAAGRLEAQNVSEYDDARDDAAMLGLGAWTEQLQAMRVEEDRHEHWFGDAVKGHWLLPMAVRIWKWRPPA